MKHTIKSIASLGLVLLLSGLFVFGCGDDDVLTPAQTEFDVIQPATDAYTGNASQSAIVKAQDLFDNINDGDATNDYVVVSVRSAEHFALGHVPGAINIPWRTVGQQANLDLLTQGSKIAVYCYTGHTGGIATTLLNAMGYEAYNMKFGMGSWTTDAAVRVASPFTEATDGHDFAVETTINNPTATFDIPTTEYTAVTDPNAILLAACDFVATNIAAVAKAQDLFDNLNDGNAANDPIVVSVRSAEHYALGHVPGAINIPWRSIADEDNLQKLDPTKEIVVYCYTGHTGAVATTALKLLGYNAANMKFGIMSWTQDAAVRVAAPFTEATDAHDFPLEQ